LHSRSPNIEWRQIGGKLTLSFYDRALAVKRVAENQGERTSGVDGKLWGTTATKYKAIGTFTRQTFFIAPAIHSSL
jgi:RNA-directed DNA polymerase